MVQGDMKDLLGIIVVFSIGGIIASALLPTAIDDVLNQTFSNSSVEALWYVLPVAMVLGPLVVMIYAAVDKA